MCGGGGASMLAVTSFFRASPQGSAPGIRVHEGLEHGALGTQNQAVSKEPLSIVCHQNHVTVA